ncbi:MAG: type II toxin-antitoxin system VapC family toxin [Cyanobacteria bacterium P01_C01_bin.89]
MDIVLDTNVVSEAMKPGGSTIIKSWSARQSRATFYTTSITEAEIFYGIRILPQGQRRQTLMGAALQIFSSDFAGRILPFDSVAANYYSHIASYRRKIGRPIAQFDAQIAATCRAQGAAIATRNVSDFEDCTIEIINPWTD